MLDQVAMILFGIICGSVLFGSLLPKMLKKIDVTELAEDHNPGTANAMKYAGLPIGLMCLAGDLLKGMLPIHLALRLGMETGSLFPLIMAAPVLGHAYSLFHGGKGGKAIAVSFGVLLGLLPVNAALFRMLCVLYITTSTLVRINPHTRRTRITFLCFAAGATALYFLRRLPAELWLGGLLISGLVVHKNSIRQQRREEGLLEEPEGNPSKRKPDEKSLGRIWY
ncbi:MAG: glycerol-3-phosphate acyltransferase [Roseburia sp.]|nr:glycerol-3-phosphate acyltransferase [Roseburia sp.]MCM1099296.1 glycerol-3-phosphate acyltransferase [Ruminococcus flavefaciens]